MSGRVAPSYVCERCKRGYDVWLWLVFHRIMAGHWHQSGER